MGAKPTECGVGLKILGCRLFAFLAHKTRPHATQLCTLWLHQKVASAHNNSQQTHTTHSFWLALSRGQLKPWRLAWRAPVSARRLQRVQRLNKVAVSSLSQSWRACAAAVRVAAHNLAQAREGGRVCACEAIARPRQAANSFNRTETCTQMASALAQSLACARRRRELARCSGAARANSSPNNSPPPLNHTTGKAPARPGRASLKAQAIAATPQTGARTPAQTGSVRAAARLCGGGAAAALSLSFFCPAHTHTQHLPTPNTQITPTRTNLNNRSSAR